jgi:alginate O-acetyltransferase complex protein AlgI
VNFVQIEFIWFMAIVLVAYWALGRLVHGRTLQNLLLVIGSAVFYGWVHPWFLTLLYFSAVMDFTIGRLMERHRQ